MVSRLALPIESGFRHDLTFDKLLQTKIDYFPDGLGSAGYSRRISEIFYPANLGSVQDYMHLFKG